MTTRHEVARAEGRDLRLSRWFDAPRELVFRAWTEPEHMAQWWGPHDFTTPVCELDPRPGGVLLLHMQAPGGAIMPNEGEFHEVDPPALLTFTLRAFPDERGEARLHVLVTAAFAEARGGTELTLKVDVLRAVDMEGPLSGMEQGWSQSLEKLRDLLAAPRGRA